jgi:hypothetical protein
MLEILHLGENVRLPLLEHGQLMAGQGQLLAHTLLLTAKKNMNYYYSVHRELFRVSLCLSTDSSCRARASSWLIRSFSPLNQSIINSIECT